MEILRRHAVAIRRTEAHRVQPALPQRQRLIREQNICTYHHAVAQPAARRTRAIGAVEGEHARAEFLDGDAAVRAGVIHGEEQFALVHHVHDDQAAGALRRRLDGIRQTALELLAGADNQAVNDDFNRVLLLFVQRRHFFQPVQLAVHPHARETALARLLEHFDMFALFAADDGRQHHQLRAFGVGDDCVHHLVNGLLADFLAALRAMRMPHARIKQAQIIVDFRHRADGRARIAAGGFLVNGDSGGQAVNLVNIGLLHLPQKLPRIAGQAFHIAPLSLGINGIERQRAFARPGQPRKHNKLVARDGQADIAQVMLSCAANDDLVVHRCNPPWLRNTV